MPNSNLHVRILSPKELIFDALASSVSSKNSQGPFDILAEHANFITIIENQPISIHLSQGKPAVFTFPLAIILTIKNKVDIYTYSQPATTSR